MISAKKLIKLAKKWQKLAALRRKTNRIATNRDEQLMRLSGSCFKLAEEEFGLPSNGPLTLPCDAELIEYVVGLIKQGITRDLEKAILVFIASSRCSLFSDLHHHQVTDHQLPICSF
ncbi:hypothetical protein OIU77_002297 [Salix suchowensis]|uniref:Uncharacterized protein n=1 Tax=Salix suchowensis TaxID=1278906 RepID=A0ABQ9B670_9ROSI|nr:hypothetical protein OIU77_002297 [Salix suchowensis]